MPAHTILDIERGQDLRAYGEELNVVKLDGKNVKMTGKLSVPMRYIARNHPSHARNA